MKKKRVLEEFENCNFKEFNVIDIFNVKNSGNILSRDIIENSGKTPYLCASSENNRVSSYITYNDKYLDKGDCIFLNYSSLIFLPVSYLLVSNSHFTFKPLLVVVDAIKLTAT